MHAEAVEDRVKTSNYKETLFLTFQKFWALRKMLKVGASEDKSYP